MKRGLKPAGTLSAVASPQGAAESTPMKRGLKPANPDLHVLLGRAAESTPMKRGLKHDKDWRVLLEVVRGRREHPDEEGTET